MLQGHPVRLGRLAIGNGVFVAPALGPFLDRLAVALIVGISRRAYEVAP